MTFSAEQSLGSLVTADARIAAIFEAHRIDYCCGGHRSLAEACAQSNQSAEHILQEIHALATIASTTASSDEEQIDWEALSLSELVDHIQETHHVYVRNEVPRLLDLVHTVTSVHCLNHPELVDIKITFDDLCADLAAHMQKEEQVLFPMIKELDHANNRRAPHSPFGNAQNPIRVMESEHEDAGKALQLLRELSDDYAIPSDSCNSYTLMLNGLEAFEKDLHRHVHKENKCTSPSKTLLAINKQHRSAQSH